MSSSFSIDPRAHGLAPGHCDLAARRARRRRSRRPRVVDRQRVAAPRARSRAPGDRDPRRRGRVLAAPRRLRRPVAVHLEPRLRRDHDRDAHGARAHRTVVETVDIFTPPESNVPDAFVYAAKAHPMLPGSPVAASSRTPTTAARSPTSSTRRRRPRCTGRTSPRCSRRRSPTDRGAGARPRPAAARPARPSARRAWR